MESLRQFITDPQTGKFYKGAKTRVSEHLGISRPWIEKLLNETWLPNLKTIGRIEDMICERKVTFYDKRTTRHQKKVTE